MPRLKNEKKGHTGEKGHDGVYFWADKEVWMLFQYCARKRGMTSWQAIHPLLLIFIEESFEEKGISTSASSEILKQI